jgi:hypothetical protein
MNIHGVLALSNVSRFRAAYIVSRLPDNDAEPIDEISGSNLNRAYSRRDESQSGVSLAMCGLSTSTRYACSELAICSSAHAEKTDILTITCAFELRPFRSPIAALSDSPTVF